MRAYTPLVIAVVLGGPLVVAAVRQAQTPVSLSATLRAHLQDEQLQTVTSVRGFPIGVRDALQELFGSGSLDIVDVGASVQSSPVVTRVIRRLVVAGCAVDHCLVYYEIPGPPQSWRVALFYWTPAATKFEAGGTAPAGLKTIDEVRRALFSGTITGRPKDW